jgi:hypothetical protein
VTVVPLILAIATLLLPLVGLTVNVPPLVFLLTVNVADDVGYVTDPLLALNVNVFAFFAVVTVCVALDAA